MTQTAPPKMIQDALGIESDDVVNYCFPTQWPSDRERRARYIGEWLKTEARYLASLPSPAASRRPGPSRTPCFIVRDATRQALACVYFEGKPGRRGICLCNAELKTALLYNRLFDFYPKDRRVSMSHAKQASTKRKRSINAVPVLSAAGLSLSLASGASAAIKPAADMPTPKTGMSHEITSLRGGNL
jgi:hypothetical protein